ncbi:MAG: YlxR family protein [Vampirovibrionales bacterium]|nr:YlxR family protein [Vampirovibrionales bacterium]
MIAAPATKSTGKPSQKRATPQKPNRKGLRLCVSCRGYFTPTQLLKVKNDAIIQGPSAVLFNTNPIKAPLGGGRSAYCCRTQQCLQQALGRKHLQRALKTPLPDATLQSLHEILDALSMA